MSSVCVMRRRGRHRARGVVRVSGGIAATSRSGGVRGVPKAAAMKAVSAYIVRRPPGAGAKIQPGRQVEVQLQASRRAGPPYRSRSGSA